MTVEVVEAEAVVKILEWIVVEVMKETKSAEVKLEARLTVAGVIPEITEHWRWR